MEDLSFDAFLKESNNSEQPLSPEAAEFKQFELDTANEPDVNKQDLSFAAFEADTGITSDKKDEEILTQMEEDNKPPSFTDILMGKADRVDDPNDTRSWYDKMKYDYNKNVAQVIRDDWGIGDKARNEGAWFQPDTVVAPDGKTYMTGNKNFNDMTNEQYEATKRQMQKEVGDETFYTIMNKASGINKDGFTAQEKGVWDRWGNDPAFQAMWEVKENIKMKNAKKLERLSHGRQENLDNRVFDYGKSNDNKLLASGATEMVYTPGHKKYKAPKEALFGTDSTGSQPTEIQANATETVSNELTENQKYQAEQVKFRANSKTTTDITKMTNQDFWKKAGSAKSSKIMAEMFKKRSEHVDKDKAFYELNEGTIPEDVLESTSGWQQLAKDLDGRIADLSSSEVYIKEDGTSGVTETTDLQRAQNLSKFMSEIGWNMTTLLARGIDVSKSPELAGQLADAMEIYQTTKTDAVQVARGLGNLATDPLNAVGLAASGINKLVGKKAASEGIIASLRSIAKRSMQNPKGMAANVIKSPTSATAVTGAGYTGIDDAVRQGVAIKGNRQKDFDFERSGKAMTMGLVAGGVLAQATKAFSGKAADYLPKTTVDQYDIMIQQAIKKSQDNSLPRPERAFLRKEVVRMRKFREKLSTRKINVDAKAEFERNKKIFDDMTVQIAREARDPKNHPYVAKFYGLETFEKNAEQPVIIEKNAAQEVEKTEAQNADIDKQINTEKSQIESTTKEKVQEDEALEVIKFDDAEEKYTETRQPQDLGKEIDIDTSKLDTSNKDLAEIVSLRESKAAIQLTVDSTGNQTQKQTDGMANYSRSIEKTVKKLEAEGYTRKEISEAMKTKKSVEIVDNIKKDKKPSFRITLDGDELEVYKVTTRKKNHYYYIDNEDTIRFDSRMPMKNDEDIKRVFAEKIKPRKGKKKIPDKRKEVIVETNNVAKRGFIADGYLQGHTQGVTGFAQTRVLDNKYDTKSIDATDNHISAKMEAFQQKDEMIKTYGQNASKEGRDKVSGRPLPKRDYTPEEKLGRRASYELNQIGKALAKRGVTSEVREHLIQRSKDLIKHVSSVKKPGVLKNNPELQKRIDDFYESQYQPMKDYDNKVRADEIKEQYRFIKEAGTKPEKVTIQGKKKPNPEWSEFSRRQQYAPYNSKKLSDGTRVRTTSAEKNAFIRKIYKKMDSEHRALGKKIGQLEDRVHNQLLEKGIQDDLSVLPKTGVDTDAVKQIQRYRDLSDDLADFKSKKIKHEELLYRETQRMDEDIPDKLGKYKSKDGMSTDEALGQIHKEYAELGLNTTPSSSVETKGLFSKPKLTRTGKDKYKYGQYPIEKQADGSYNIFNKEGKAQNFPTRKDTAAEAQRRIDWVEEKKAPEREMAKMEKEAQERADIVASNKGQLEKFTAFNKRNQIQKRRTRPDEKGFAKETVTELQEDLLNAGITPQQLADMSYPREATKETLGFWKKHHKKEVYTQLNEKSRERLNILSQIRFMENPAALSFEGMMIDASNSMLQMMTILTGSRDFGGFSKLTGDKADARTAVGDYMQDVLKMELPKKMNEDGVQGSWKDFVKPLFMTENYGQGERGLVNTLQNLFDFEPDLAKSFYDGYKKAMGEIFPEIGIFKDIINQRMKYPEMGKDIHWTMPDGERITLTIEEETKGKYTIRSEKDSEFIEFTSDLDTVSSSLMPSYIQSYDAYIAKEMRNRGYITNHDAFVPIDKTKTQADVHKDYGEILSDILESDSLNKNLKEMMPETKLKDGSTSITPQIKKGDMTREDIMNSPHKMEIEHPSPKGPEHDVAKARKIENEKWKTDEELMRDFMASSNMRNIDTHSLTDSIVDNIGRNTDYAKIMEKQDVFERQAALATKSGTYDKGKGIPAPKGVDQKTWDMTQQNIFYESRAKLEQNPNAREVLEGERLFFQENGKPIGDTRLTKKEVEQMFRIEDFKSRQEYNKNVDAKIKRINQRNIEIQKNIVDLENSKGKAIFSNFRPAEKKLAQRIGKTYIQMARKTKSWSENKLLNEAENFAKQVVEEARANEPSNGKVNDLIDKEKVKRWTAYYIRQVVENKPEYKQLQELSNLSKKYGNDSARFKEGLRKNLERDIPEAERELWTKMLLNTDYAAIDGYTKKIADQFMKDHADTYKLLKKYIDAAADGLNTPEKQTGFYRNNATVIARQKGFTDDMIPIIDQMISIKAMSDEAWKFVETKKNDANFIKTMERIKYNQEVSRKVLFADNPESIIKGYTEQVTNSNYTLDKNGKKIYNADPEFTRGHFDTDLEGKKRGKEIGEMTNPELKKSISNIFENIKRIEKEIASTPRERQELRMRSLHDSILFVQKNKDNPKFENIIPGIEKNIQIEKQKMRAKGMSSIAIDRRIEKAGPRSEKEIEIMKLSADEKVILRNSIESLNKQSGGALNLNKPINDVNSFIAKQRNLKLSQKDVRKVAGEEVREELGRSHDIVDILSETIGNTEIKMGRRKKIEDMQKANFDLLYRTEPKKGFVKLTEEEVRTLPRGLRDDVKYINDKFYDHLMGRESVSLSKNASQGWKVVDRLVRDATTRFKKNNVLSNSASHVNALMYNQVVAPSIGITPNKQGRYQMEALRDMQQLTEIYQTISDKHSRGMDISKEMEKLQKNELYLMEQEGLSTNTIDGISQDPDLWRQIVSDATGSIEKKLGTKFNKTRTAANNLFAEGDSWIGQKFNALFTSIDTSGRYMVAKHYMSPEGGGLSRADAAVKANGLFGDMDQLAPQLIEFLDKYPAMPFIKWWTSVAPGTAKMFKENPVKALSMAMLTYYAMRSSENEDEKYEASGFRTTGWNPLFGNIDFPESMVTGQYDDWKNDINRNTSWGEKIGRRTSKYMLPSFITKPSWKYSTESQKKNPEYSKLATGFVYSNADKNYSNVKGAPLELEGITDEAMRTSETWFMDQ